MIQILRFFCFSALTAVVLLLYAPTVFVALEGFSLSRRGVGKGLFDFLGDRAIQEALWNSLIMAFPSAIFATAICTGCLLWVNTHHSRRANLILGALLLPFFASNTIVGMVFPEAAKTLLGFTPGLTTGIAAMTAAALPLCAVIIAVQLKSYSPDIGRVAATLGANPRQVFVRLTLPLIGGTLLAATLMGFLYAFNNTEIALFATGRITTVPALVWGKLRHGFDASIFQLSSLLTIVFLIAALASSAIVGLAFRRRENRQGSQIR